MDEHLRSASLKTVELQNVTPKLLTAVWVSVRFPERAPGETGSSADATDGSVLMWIQKLIG